MTKVNLSIRVGPAGRELVFFMKSNPCKIGRADDCDLKLESRTVSRQHCQLKLKSKGLTVADLHSRNGTYVNGQLIVPGERTLLHEGDELKVGKYFLKVLSNVSSSVDTDPPLDSSEATDASTNPGEVDDLLSDLEQFITGYRLPNENATEETLGQIQPTSQQPASMVSQLSIEEEIEPTAGTEHETNINNQSAWQKPATREATEDTVANLSTEETQSDLAEARRLEMRRRLEEMKAKDSKEAAERALKNLFKR